MKKANINKPVFIQSLFAWLGIILGIVISLIGFKVKNEGYTRETVKFGGDFYTEIYGVTRNAAMNVEYGVEGIGWILVAFGATDICLFGYKLGEAARMTDAPSFVLPKQ